MKKISIAILAALLAVSVMGSCRKDDVKPAESSGTTAGTKNTEETTTSPVTSAPSATDPASTEPVSTAPATSEPVTTEPPVTEPKGDPVELVKNNAGDDNWDVIEGVWSGTLRTGAGGLEPCERIINDKGELVIRSVSKSETTTADHGVGNYIGVSEILKPNTTYTVTVIAKFNSNPTHKLHIKYPGVYDNVFVRASGDVSGASPVAISDSADFEEYVYTFRTGSSLKDFFIQIGPIGVGDNNYWGAFCPGAELIIQSCVIS